MDELPRFDSHDAKIQHIEHYLIKQVDAIHRLLLVAVGVTVVASCLAVWSVVGQQRVISIAEAGVAEGAELLANGSPVASERPADTAPAVPASPSEAAPDAKPSSVEPKSAETKATQPKAVVPAVSTAATEAVDPAKPARKASNEAPVGRSLVTPARGRLAVERSTMASNIVGLSPSGESSSFPASSPQVYCWTRIITPELDAVPYGDRVVVHRWFHRDELVHERKITIGSASYRVYSMMTKLGERKGSWRVDVEDAKGRLLASERFTVE